MRTIGALADLDRQRPRKTDIEVAEYLCVSVAWVRRKRLTGGGPRWVRIGGCIRYSVEDLEAYLAAVPSGGGIQATASDAKMDRGNAGSLVGEEVTHAR